MIEFWFSAHFAPDADSITVLCIKSNYAPTLYTDSLFFTPDAPHVQIPTLRDLSKDGQPFQNSKQQIVLFKYIKTLYC